MVTKRIFLVVAAFVVLAALSLFPSARVGEALAQGGTFDEPGVITVTGSAEIRVVPDEVVLTLGVESFAKDLKLATLDNDTRVAAVLKLAETFVIAAEQVKVDFITVEPHYVYNSGEVKYRDGYFVRKTIVFTLKDISKFDALLSAALNAGADYVHGIDFRTTELRKYRDQARDLAIKAAQEKAEALSGALGQTIGRPTSIQEYGAGWQSFYGSWWGRGNTNNISQNVIQSVSSDPAPEIEGTFAPGQIVISATVGVTFEMHTNAK
ncbi:MAG TPA: SIMPL domain-containing protein [Aggregatilineales bacterium]|nr:SIMPL domain-containing protein [Anaerolineales bacterium]HRE46377.1 SIMPL domain-containing protein [Aggregatilineales bacterium]